MKIVIFGLSVSSSWGNGHATIWRGLVRELIRRKHRIVFFEKDVPYYADHRDLHRIEGGQLCLYSDWESARSVAATHLRDADAAIVTSYCPDGIAATDLVINSNVAVRVFYDLDAPVTLDRLRCGANIPYLTPEGLGGFDLVLSYTGGTALSELKERLNARRVAPLYGSVDPSTHRPVPPQTMFRSDLSYLGTYSEDRQKGVGLLLIETARVLSDRRFAIGGPQYPADFPWLPNIFYFRHVAPCDHPGFYCSSRLTLNVTRRPMARMGFCPSGRLFEAAACGTPIVSDHWPGIDQFFTPGKEILIADSTEDVIDAMQMSDEQLQRIARAAAERVSSCHTAAHRAAELENLLERVPLEA
jgi:spore maturation protein CgeB